MVYKDIYGGIAVWRPADDLPRHGAPAPDDETRVSAAPGGDEEAVPPAAREDGLSAPSAPTREETDFYGALGTAFGDFIRHYNNKLIFSKDVQYERPLDRIKAGSTAYRNTLFLLKNSGPQRMSELADNINCDRGNMTKMIDDLFAKGVVRRFRSPADRRVVMVELTPEGSALIERESDTFVRNAKAMFGRFPDKEREQFARAMKFCADFMAKL